GYRRARGHAAQASARGGSSGGDEEGERGTPQDQRSVCGPQGALGRGFPVGVGGDPRRGGLQPQVQAEQAPRDLHAHAGPRDRGGSQRHGCGRDDGPSSRRGYPRHVDDEHFEPGTRARDGAGAEAGQDERQRDWTDGCQPQGLPDGPQLLED
ncbi:unnamed protein product, partial [Ectocarpus fasciculatus]